MARVIVVRKPCLMEDEGRSFLVGQFETKEKAREWIQAQKGEYFGPGDYAIMVEET